MIPCCFGRCSGDGQAREEAEAKQKATAKLAKGLVLGDAAKELYPIKMKDEQLRILNEQNAQLLRNLDKVEEDANNIQLEKLATEEETRALRAQHFALQSKARAAVLATVVERFAAAFTEAARRCWLRST